MFKELKEEVKENVEKEFPMNPPRVVGNSTDKEKQVKIPANSIAVIIPEENVHLPGKTSSTGKSTVHYSYTYGNKKDERFTIDGESRARLQISLYSERK